MWELCVASTRHPYPGHAGAVGFGSAPCNRHDGEGHSAVVLAAEVAVVGSSGSSGSSGSISGGSSASSSGSSGSSGGSVGVNVCVCVFV